MISGHVHLLSILSWGILVYQTSMSFCCTSFYNAGLKEGAKVNIVIEIMNDNYDVIATIPISFTLEKTVID